MHKRLEDNQTGRLAPPRCSRRAVTPARLATSAMTSVADLIPLASSMALTGTAEQLSQKIAGLTSLGVTELVYQPAGSDIERELRAFAAASGLIEL